MKQGDCVCHKFMCLKITGFTELMGGTKLAKVEYPDGKESLMLVEDLLMVRMPKKEAGQ
jgi:hypothetical protein